MDNRIQLNKLDSARRQLSVAIRLLLDNDDPVAVDTLVGAVSTKGFLRILFVPK